MKFLYPSMLWALTALAIPIAVHLFNFRRYKKVYFSNTEVLKTIQLENSKTRKLKHLLALLCRCLFIVGLVLAFAFPYRDEASSSIRTDEGVVGVFIDNSMSMNAQSSKTTLLEDARESARDIVNRFSPSTRYLLLTNSFEVANEYPMNQEEMLNQLDRMRLDGPPVKMNAVIDRFAMLRRLHGFDQATLFVYSDFQRNMFDLEGVAADSTLNIILVPMSASVQSNVSIDSVWLSSPVMRAGLANEVHVMINNDGDREVKGLPVNLAMDGKVTASATVDLEPQGKAEVTLQFLLHENGRTPCVVSLMDYPITFDDSYRFVIETRPTLSVVELGGSDRLPFVGMVFADDPQYEYRRMSPDRIDLAELAKAQLIVVDQASEVSASIYEALLDDAANGACVAFFHDDAAAIDTNAMSVGALALQHEFFRDVILDMPQHADLPRVKRHVPIRPTADASVLAHLDNGDPLLTQRKIGQGFVFDFATTLDEQWSGLADNALFVPLMLKMALMGGGVEKLAYTLGTDLTVLFDDLGVTGLDDLRVKNEDGSFEMMPSHELRNNRVCVFFYDELPAAGFYTVSKMDTIFHLMAWNDNRQESEMKFVEDDALRSAFEAAGLPVLAVMAPEEFTGNDLMEDLARQSTLWRWWALLALLALIGEIAVLRF